MAYSFGMMGFDFTAAHFRNQIERFFAAAPDGWPKHAAIRADKLEGLPPQERLLPHMTFFEDPRAKEMTLTPKGVRLVYLASEGVRAHYLVLRDAELGDFQVPESLLQALLARARDLYLDLEEKP